MQQTPHDESWRWLVTLFASAFAGGIGWLVKHLMGRESSHTQLGLAQAQTEQIRAAIRREDEAAEFRAMRELAQEARADVQRLRDERDYWQTRAEKAERHLLVEELDKLQSPPSDGKGT